MVDGIGKIVDVVEEKIFFNFFKKILKIVSIWKWFFYGFYRLWNGWEKNVFWVGIGRVNIMWIFCWLRKNRIWIVDLKIYEILRL